MEKFLIFIKHHFKFLWKIIEWGNGIVFLLVYSRKLDTVTTDVFKEFTDDNFTFRKLNLSDVEPLYNLIRSQNASDLEYFKPHGLDLHSIRKQHRNHAFLMMGSFANGNITGYFFLRFFINRKCFVGRLIDEKYRGRGIGLVMNKIMYETAWRMNFRCLSTISRNNKAVMKAHSRNQSMLILKELQNDYLLVEFIRGDNIKDHNGVKEEF
jgi:hypothetical protein